MSLPATRVTAALLPCSAPLDTLPHSEATAGGSRLHACGSNMDEAFPGRASTHLRLPPLSIIGRGSPPHPLSGHSSIFALLKSISGCEAGSGWGECGWGAQLPSGEAGPRSSTYRLHLPASLLLLHCRPCHALPTLYPPTHELLHDLRPLLLVGGGQPHGLLPLVIHHFLHRRPHLGIYRQLAGATVVLVGQRAGVCAVPHRRPHPGAQTNMDGGLMVVGRADACAG